MVLRPLWKFLEAAPNAYGPVHPRIAPILMKIGGIEAKFHGEFEFEVQKSLAPRKLGKKRKKLFPEDKNQ